VTHIYHVEYILRDQSLIDAYLSELYLFNSSVEVGQDYPVATFKDDEIKIQQRINKLEGSDRSVRYTKETAEALIQGVYPGLSGATLEGLVKKCFQPRKRSE
jgi:hypothetical protein